MPIGALGAAGLAISGGSLIGSLLNRPKFDTPDISGELNNISALFSQLREQSRKNINYEAGQGRGLAASNLAARGVYSSPVSENVFGRLERDRLNAISNSEAEIGAREAQARASLLGQLLGINQQNQIMGNQANANLFGQFGGIGSSLLLASLLNPAAGAASGAAKIPYYLARP